jgi:hypothetical protein
MKRGGGLGGFLILGNRGLETLDFELVTAGHFLLFPLVHFLQSLDLLLMNPCCPFSFLLNHAISLLHESFPRLIPYLYLLIQRFLQIRQLFLVRLLNMFKLLLVIIRLLTYRLLNRMWR